MGKEATMEFQIIESMVLHTLRNYEKYTWTLQGLGMLRTSLPNGFRMHVWDSKRIWVKNALMHTHPWRFRSLIVSGMIINTRFKEMTSGPGTEEWMGMTIKCGPGSCAKSEPKKHHLLRMPSEVYVTGDMYEQAAHEVHLSQARDGTVSIIERKEDTEEATVFWSPAYSWDSAEAMTPNLDSIKAICGLALSAWQS